MTSLATPPVALLDPARIALEEHLKLAAEIQRRLLPTIPAEALNCRWCARMVPAYEVGGDFCAYLMRVAGMAPGPPGAGGDWQDDRTSLSFRVLHPR
jgi:hypothetical protein